MVERAYPAPFSGIFNRLSQARNVFPDRIFPQAAIRPVVEEGLGEVSLQRLFFTPIEGARCDGNFVESYKLFYQAFGATKKGAQRHFELLQRMQPGYRFYGIASYPEDAYILMLRDQQLAVGVREDHQMYDPKGKRLEGPHVALAHFPQAQKPV